MSKQRRQRVHLSTATSATKLAMLSLAPASAASATTTSLYKCQAACQTPHAWWARPAAARQQRRQQGGSGGSSTLCQAGAKSGDVGQILRDGEALWKLSWLAGMVLYAGSKGHLSLGI